MHRLPTIPKFTKSWEMFEYNLLFVRRLVDFVGLDFMIENYKFNWRTGSAVFFCVTVFSLSLYSTAFYYPDMYKICEVSIPLSICLQSAFKLYYGYRHRHFYLETLVGFVDVFASDMNDLDRMLDSGDRNEEFIRDKVKSICGQHQHIIEYESDLDERYIVICFVQVFTSISGVVVALFLVYMIQFIPGYMLVLASFVQLLQLCLLGTVLTVKVEFSYSQLNQR
ncbi:hypothetical protein pipiens_011555 [Culex pipiens pipiens]|uniref:Odorant receptor n=1 Tax=Culex pipiens pipiens TaxID=38569 RepID=A0ABD1D5W2_CULPP